QADARRRRISLRRPIENERSGRPSRAGGREKDQIVFGAYGSSARASGGGRWVDVGSGTQRGERRTAQCHGRGNALERMLGFSPLSARCEFHAWFWGQRPLRGSSVGRDF